MGETHVGQMLERGPLDKLRGGAALTAFALLTLPLLPVQWLAVKLHRVAPPALWVARWLPVGYHRCVCALLGLRVRRHGKLRSGSPLLVLANHASWADIPVLSSVGPVSFVAKSEVGGWPGVATLANLQRTLYIRRAERSDVRNVGAAISERLALGDTIMVFPEGTSSDGNSVLAFRSSLLAPFTVAPREREQERKRDLGRAAAAANDGQPSSGSGHTVQFIAVAYTGLDGLPLGRDTRPLIAWFGDMDLPGHAWEILCAGPLEVHVWISEPLPREVASDRKRLAAEAEEWVRAQQARLLRGMAAP